jgi:hypothetical protein
MKIISFLTFVIPLVVLTTQASVARIPDGKHIASHKVIVTEVIQTSNYTYLHVKESDSLKWLAVPSMQALAGDTYYYSEGLPMQQFESKELHRTFDLVLFLGGVSTEPIGSKPAVAANPHGGQTGSQPYTRKATPDVKKDIKIDAPKDCITIAELFSKKDTYAGKIVKIKGQVTKFSAEIMNKNWIHLQDGTENNGKFDLTVTSAVIVKTGDIVTLEGKVVLNKDFGYGYLFEVLMEDAALK